MKHQLVPLVLTVFLSLLSYPFATAQSSSLARRFSEDSFRRSLRLNVDAPMFASEADAKAYRDYHGEWKWESVTAGGYDSNVFQDATGKEDWRWNYSTTLGYEWWTQGDAGVVITPSIGIGSLRFNRFGDELDGDMLNAGLNITFEKWCLSPALIYNAGWLFSRGYDEHTYTEQALGIELGRKHHFRKSSVGSENEDSPFVAWKLSGGHVFAYPEEFSANQAAFGLESELPLTDKLKLVLNTSAGFRDYTENSAMGRDTWTFNTGAALAWTFHKKNDPGEQSHELLFGTSYYHAADRLPGLDADQFTAYVALKFAWDGFNFLGLPRGSN